jgi:hypothetical protein
MLPAPTVKASNPPSARALRFFSTDDLNTDKSMEDLPFLEVFSTTSRGDDQSSNRYTTYRRANANALGNLRELGGIDDRADDYL